MIFSMPMSSPSPDTSSSSASVFSDHEAWHRLYDQASREARHEVANIVERHAPALASHFYATLLADVQAAPLLSHDLVAHRLSGSLQAWLRSLFCSPDAPDVAALVALQQHVGEVHARLSVSVPLVSRGARILKETMSQLLRDGKLSRNELSMAQQYLGSLIDLALEVMSAAYMQDSRRGARADEAYRLFTLGQNAATERERQRAALLEWSHTVLLRTPFHGRTVDLPALRSSEFGLWLHHKGSAMFDGTAELPTIVAAMSSLDSEILPALARAVTESDAVALAGMMQAFQRKVDDIKYLLMTLFDRVSAVEGGRDPLTQLLNRRFLPTVLAREIAMATTGQGTFSVFLADIDHFKQINDGYGHGGGDAVLRQVAELLQDTCRTGDYVFRYGGEEFLVVLVDARADVLEQIAEKLRSAVEQHHFRLPDGQSLPVTISIGGAAFDGHPDPDILVARADKALYAAKAAGRNSWKLG